MTEICCSKIMAMIFFFVDQNQKNTKLSEIIDFEKLERVNKPIEGANAFQMNVILMRTI